MKSYIWSNAASCHLCKAILALGILSSSNTSAALQFKEVDNMLVAYDCGALGTPPAPCKSYERSFSGSSSGYPGDAAVLKEILTKKRYEEVLLISGGGNLNEGLNFGRILRQFQMAVRVPSGYSCVSACTIAFLGGLFRTVEENATYKMHAYSGLLGGISAEDQAAYMSDTERKLAREALKEYKEARGWSARLFIYAQTMVNGAPDEAQVASILGSKEIEDWYVGSDMHKRDVAKLRLEGVVAAQEIRMRMERDAMAAALDDLRPFIPRLGARAAAALRIMDTMFSSRITDTATLSQETMKRLGIVTPLLK